MRKAPLAIALATASVTAAFLTPSAANAASMRPARPASVPCSPGGICTSKFCNTTTSFTVQAHGYTYGFSFYGGNDYTRVWDEYILQNGTLVGSDWFSASC